MVSVGCLREKTPCGEVNRFHLLIEHKIVFKMTFGSEFFETMPMLLQCLMCGGAFSIVRTMEMLANRGIVDNGHQLCLCIDSTVRRSPITDSKPIQSSIQNSLQTDTHTLQGLQGLTLAMDVVFVPS